MFKIFAPIAACFVLFCSLSASAETYVAEGETISQACAAAEQQAELGFERNRSEDICPQSCDREACERTSYGTWRCPTRTTPEFVCNEDESLH